ncbi:MAG TPA: DNA replication/repair protein RecF [Candidatus Acidoferrales bacterium]|nr:DNA replication/repair protein RecF [Candidatus Acidoferrales bacterium]
MQLTHLALSNFRNYAELDLDPSAGLNVFVGANAQGKSNLLEAIAMLGTGKSFRTSRDGDTVREGVELAVVRGDARVRAGTVRLACTIAKSSRGTRKTYTVNERPVRYATFLGKVRVVTFVPSDLALASGPPAGRRALLNVALAQEGTRYYGDLARYRKTLAQKNALLRGTVAPDPELLEIYDRTLVEAGSALMLARDHFVRALAPPAAAAHRRFSNGAERLDVAYAPDVVFETPTADGVAAAFAARLRQCADAERARKTAVCGPHRDDVTLALDGRSLAAFGSQGQQRTAVLALKVAEYGVMRERAGEAPLLLLDDVLSELDRDRAAAFLSGIGEYEQAFVTATNLPPGLPAGVRTYVVEDARVRTAA